MNKVSSLFLIILLASFVSLSCGQALPTPATKAAGEREWDKALSEAKKEAELVIMIGPGVPNSYRQEFTKELQSKYGITLNFIVGQGSQLVQKASGFQRSDYG